MTGEWINRFLGQREKIAAWCEENIVVIGNSGHCRDKGFVKFPSDGRE